jgi:hypothetical protein
MTHLKSGQWGREWVSKPAFAAWNMEIILAFAIIQAKKRRRSNSTESNKIIYYELFAEQHRFIIKNLEICPLVLRIKLSLSNAPQPKLRLPYKTVKSMYEYTGATQKACKTWIRNMNDTIVNIDNILLLFFFLSSCQSVCCKTNSARSRL